MFQLLRNTATAALVSLLLMSNICAMEDVAFIDHANQYKSFLGQQSTAPKYFNTPVDAFKDVAKTVTDITGGSLYHGHIKEGKAFGRSFTAKNQPALNYVFKLLTGQVKNWPKEAITSDAADIRIADVGCGLGISAVYLFSKLADFYQAAKWQFVKPLEFDLFDVKEEHQPALSNLVNLVNLAYPQYFKVNTFVHDVTNSFPYKNHYKIVLNLNVMHYIPANKWSLTLNNTNEAMHPNGMMFVVTDHYCAGAGGNPIEEAKLLAASRKSNFFQTAQTLYSPKLSANEGTYIINYDNMELINRNDYVPGETYGKESITSKSLSPFLRTHMEMNGKNTICLADSKGQRVETKLQQITNKFNSGELVLHAGSYGFDNDSLERAIFSVLDSSNPGFKKLSLGWATDSNKTYTFSGITLMKVANPTQKNSPSAQKGVAG